MRKTLSGSPLKGKRLMGPMRLIGLIGLMGLMSCSSDFEEELQPESIELGSVTGYVTGFEEAARANRVQAAHEANAPQGAVTRAWEPPTDPNSGKPYEFFADADAPISVFFTQTTGDPVGGYEEEFFFKSSSKWRVSKADLEDKTYYLYGYRPNKEYIEPSITKLSGEGKTWAHGAVLTLSNVNTIMPEDLCIIVGAKNGTDADNHGGLTTGNFAYAAQPTSGVGMGNNYVYLLFDHLYSAMRFKLRVQGDYAALRTIKLKDLSLKAFQGAAATTKKMDVVVTLSATDGTDPISSIVFTPHGTEEAAGSFFSHDSGYELGTSWSIFQAHFMSEGVTKLQLTSTYDVYDTKGNKIRENCKATNNLDISDLFDRQTESKRGTRYTISMTITPTYLYVLSDPDLDNPTVVLN